MVHGHALACAAGGLLALATVACDDAPQGAPGGGTTRPPPDRPDVIGLPPPPNTVVPCRPLEETDPRALFTVTSSETIVGSVAPAFTFEEVVVAYPDGGSGPTQVTVETVGSDGSPFADDTAATPEHGRVRIPVVGSTPAATIVAYTHSDPAPFRAHAVARRGDAGAWSTPVRLSADPVRGLALATVGSRALVFLATEADEDDPTRLHVAVVDEDGAVAAGPTAVPGSDGVRGFAAAARGARVSVVFDVPSEGSDGRTLFHQVFGGDGSPVDGPDPVAVDRAFVGEPAVLRGPPDDGSNADVVLAAWTELAAGAVPKVHLARVGDGAFEDTITRNDATGSDPALAPLIEGWFALFFRSHDRDAIRARVARPYRTGGLVVDDLFPLGSATGPLAASSARDGWGVGLVWTEDAGSGSRILYATTRCTDRQ